MKAFHLCFPPQSTISQHDARIIASTHVFLLLSLQSSFIHSTQKKLHKEQSSLGHYLGGGKRNQSADVRLSLKNTPASVTFFRHHRTPPPFLQWRLYGPLWRDWPSASQPGYSSQHHADIPWAVHVCKKPCHNKRPRSSQARGIKTAGFKHIKQRGGGGYLNPTISQPQYML